MGPIGPFMSLPWSDLYVRFENHSTQIYLILTYKTKYHMETRSEKWPPTMMGSCRGEPALRDPLNHFILV